MPAKLRCFVAMAFGHNDTDAIFKILRKTLGPLGINAQRVDRIEHNDNIDTKIISEIETADLVIADLTYARPSVYFEAGYAQRAIPVIFMASGLYSLKYYQIDAPGCDRPSGSPSALCCSDGYIAESCGPSQRRT